MASMSMADLLSSQTKIVTLNRGQEIQGKILAKNPGEMIIDLGAKAEGVLFTKEIPNSLIESYKIGDKITVVVIQPENDSGQVVVGWSAGWRSGRGGAAQSAKWLKFEELKRTGEVTKGRGSEVNKGGLVVEIGGMRGFLPLSQMTLTQSANLDSLIGQELEVKVIEVDPGANRLIVSQKVAVSPQIQEKIAKIKIGDKVKGKVTAILPFGLFITLGDGVEGLVHNFEVSWERVEDLAAEFSVGQEIEAVVVSKEIESGRLNLSLKSLKEDPFLAIAQKYQKDDVKKGVVDKVTDQGVVVTLDENVEGIIATNNIEQGATYNPGDSITVLIDKIDTQKRKIYLSPFITSTAGLIYK